MVGKIKLEETKIGKLEEQIGKQLIGSNQEDSVRCERSAGVLAELAKHREVVACHQRECDGARKALDQKKQQLAQALQMTNIEGSKSFNAERQSCEAQIAQIENQRNAQERQLVERLLASDVQGTLGQLLGELREAQAQSEVTTASPPSSTIGSSSSSQAVPKWKPPLKLPLGFYSWPAVAALMVCCFPFGLYLVWTHPSWTRNVKVAWSAAWLLLAVTFAASQNHTKTSRSTSSLSNASDNDRKQDTSSELHVSAMALVDDYKNNEVAADEKYKGKTLKVNGFIGDIKKDITDTMYVILQSGGDYELRNVQCFFADSEKEKLTQLSKGQVITVEGRCDGLMMNVLLRDCVIVK